MQGEFAESNDAFATRLADRDPGGDVVPDSLLTIREFVVGDETVAIDVQLQRTVKVTIGGCGG